MDSGNSGSLQSSSDGDGGGEVNHSTHFNHTPILQPSSNFFDPSSLSQSLNPNPNLMYNLDSLWSRNSNSNPIYDLDPYLNPNPVDDGNINPDSGPEKFGVATKNPKKRTRASRRAPTTVLTTDTTNFRQMVQEFTGIPPAPFSGSSSSSAFSRRIDLYAGGNTPVHPLRPSAQKIQLQQPSYLNSGTATTSNFHLPPSETHGFTKHPLNLSNLQNQMLPFQSLSQTTLMQQINASERENQRSETPSVFPSSLKRWRGQDENLMNFERVNGSSQNVVVSISDGDQLPGNEDSWSF
ncbi:hypothetical protein L1987_69978 [Smallanthus sonchifolius]|uniref:Uncharacterized protein n=1 Tax=Smallanthus sonchifolius TaxID=185202 RepID=A0ACB9B8A1_9ASTR|nr:hypothetical protein L1987_69978 [Smallanthus sonchifolius]